MAARTGSAEWRGDLKGGDGDLSFGDGAFSGAFTFESRFAGGEGGTNPEELIAAAHAGCFSMSLANILSGHGHEVEFVRTTAEIFIRQIDGKASLAQIDLVTEGKVPGIDQDHFAEHAEEAKAGCPVSRALAGVPEINVKATLLG